jgi:hypothetical protein
MITPIVLLVFLAHAAKPRHIKPETFSTKHAEPGHHARVPEVDDDQLAALRRRRAAFGFVEVVEVISHDPGEDLAPLVESVEGARGMEDPRRMTPAEREQAQALLARAVSDPDWRTASHALDDLMRKLLVVHRLLEAEERLAKRER